MPILPATQNSAAGELTALKVHKAALAADESRAIQNRLARTFEYYFRTKRPAVRGAGVMSLQVVTFTEGKRVYSLVRTEDDWVLKKGGGKRGAHGQAAQEAVRIPIVYRSIHRGLKQLRDQLHQNPVAPARTIPDGNRQLRTLLAGFPADLQDLRVAGEAGEKVLGVQRGTTRHVLRSPFLRSAPLVSWADFCNGDFIPGHLATELTAHVFRVSRSTVEKTRAQDRRKS